MHPSASPDPAFRPWKLAMAMLPLALASGSLLINFPNNSRLESTPDWLFRCFLLIFAAMLARALAGRLLGGAAGALLARRSLFALGLFALIGLALSGKFLDLGAAQVFFGLPLATAWAVAWRPWMRCQAAWLVLGMGAGLGAIWLVFSGGSPLSDSAAAFLPRELRRGLLLGAALWLLSLPAALGLARPADAEHWLAEPIWPRGGRRLALAGWGLLAAAGLSAAAAQGLQNCRWLDRVVGRSGCVAGLEVGFRTGSSMALTPDGGTLFVLNRNALHRIPLASFVIEQSVALSESFAIERSVLTDTLRTYQAAVTPDGARVLVIADRSIEESYVLQYAIPAMQPLPTVVLTDALGFGSLGISRDSQRIFLSRNQWRLADGAALGRIEAADLRDYVVRGRASGLDLVSPDSSLLAAVGPADIGIYRPDPRMGRGEQVSLLKGALRDYGGNESHAVFSADSSLLAVATLGDDDLVTVNVWETASGRLAASFALPDAGYGEPPMVFTADNQFLLMHNNGWLGRYRIR